ncbi:MAG: hypothetical protein FWD82_00465 [Defluviitaleaceae bacterium]|nr:hypothetical protein [Defluviitaleaceae bacterium]
MYKKIIVVAVSIIMLFSVIAFTACEVTPSSTESSSTTTETPTSPIITLAEYQAAAIQEL